MDKREILFRGKTKEDEWVFGTYHFSNDGKYHYILNREKFIKRGDYQTMHSIEVHEVIPESVSQYTGLKDKNGNKIFEADVGFMKNFGTTILIEEFRGSFGYFTSKGKLGQEFHSIATHNHISIIENTLTKFEIIGNIFDTPKLINSTSLSNIDRQKLKNII